MGTLKVDISDSVENTFRKAAMNKFGFGRGSISRAAESAFKEWSAQQNIGHYAEEEEIEDPVLMLRGLLKGVKKSSVELRHESGKIRAERWKKHVSHRR